MFKKIEVIHPKSKKDLRRCEELDAQGKLASGNSYPTDEEVEDAGKPEIVVVKK